MVLHALHTFPSTGNLQVEMRCFVVTVIRGNDYALIQMV